MSGAICGGPTLVDALTPSPRGYWPEVYVLRGEWYRPGARCHLDGRYVADVTALLGWTTMGTFELEPGYEVPLITGQTIAAVIGRCSQHGLVEADFDEVEWGDYDG